MDPLDELKLELQKIPWFRELQIKHLDMIAGITQLRDIKAGEVLFREGDRAGAIYIVLGGRVALDMAIPPRGKMRFHTAELWEVIGWSSATPVVHQRTASATAVVDGRLAVIDSTKLRELCDQDHDLGYVVMRRLANIVASRLMSSRLQLLDMFADPEIKNAK
jgi:CRP/FNR family transcriptional regulator, cyclic AMP receptor protein